MSIRKFLPRIALVSCMVWSLCACGIARTPSPTPTVVPTPTPAATIDSNEYLQVFEEVWGTVNQTFYDPNFGGVDWNAIHEKYEPLILAAEDDEAFYLLLNQMLWELNVSHAGVGPESMWPSVEPVIFLQGETGIDVRLLDNEVVITRIEAGSSADEAGLRPGFIIQSIEGTSTERIIADAQGHLAPPYNEPSRKDVLTRHLLSLIYGDPGTCVTLAYLDERDIMREGCVERIQRSRAGYTGNGLPLSYLEFESGRLENGIGYIRFNTFHRDLIPDMVEALAALQDAPGIIIDLRGNPGGDFDADGRMAVQFLDGLVTFGRIMTRSGTGPWSLTGENAYAGPLVILIDALSYSGSEFFSSGMQAVGRAVIIGERSPGGATAANITTLLNGAVLIHPVALLLTPDGKVVEGYGIVPDIAVTLDRQQLLQGIDAQLEAAIQYLLENGQ